MNKKIIIYTKSYCPYCVKAKALLEKMGIAYQTSSKLEGLVPEIWIDGEKLQDGYTSLAGLLGQEVENSKDCLGCEG